MRSDSRSEQALEYRRWYGLRAWQILRRDQFQAEPFCRMCAEDGNPSIPATVCDHVTPHRGDRALFFDPANLQSLCDFHHDKSKQDEEALGYSIAVGDDGFPTDPRHPANGGRPNRRIGWSIPDGLQPSGIPVMLVCGPPAAGKTTYVREHARKGDILIDFDLIRHKVGGTSWDFDEGVNRRAFAYRDKMIRGLASKRWGTAWLVVMAPTKAERKAWADALGWTTEVIVNPGRERCLEQMAGDPGRKATAKMQAQAIARWFDAFDGPSLPGGGSRSLEGKPSPTGGGALARNKPKLGVGVQPTRVIDETAE
jgi:5-methylcytosine-specific restriction protein A